MNLIVTRKEVKVEGVAGDQLGERAGSHVGAGASEGGGEARDSLFVEVDEVGQVIE